MALNITAERTTVIVELYGQEVHFTCRKPDPIELARYQKDVQKAVKANKIDSQKIFRVQVAYGEKVALGVRKGDIIADGKALTEENPDWKRIIRTKEPRLFAAVGRAVFENAITDNEIEDELGGGAGDAPLEGQGSPEWA